MPYITKKDIEFLEMIKKSNYLFAEDNKKLEKIIDKLNNNKQQQTEKTTKHIMEKRKISPYYSYGYEITQKHYSKEVREIQKLIKNKDYYEAKERFERNKRELLAFKTTVLTKTLNNFLNEFTDDEIKLLISIKR